MIDPVLSLLLHRPLHDGRLAFMDARTLRVESGPFAVTYAVRGGRVHLATTANPDVTVRAALADLAALALRHADADTLFFQRRLALTGDTELGLHLRNVLESLPPPIGLLQRLSRWWPG